MCPLAAELERKPAGGCGFVERPQREGRTRVFPRGRINVGADMPLDEALKLSQIVFYGIAAILTVLTYWRATRGLLNTVFTEYQRCVILRLKELSDELFAEFDEDSPKYWARSDPMKDIVDAINSDFGRARDLIRRSGEFPGGVLVGSDEHRLSALLNRTKSDPFIPKDLRAAVTDLLDSRLQVLTEVRHQVLEGYMRDLAKGKHAEDLDSNWNWLHNRVNDGLYKRGVGVA
jgi:hypothetical protein